MPSYYDDNYGHYNIESQDDVDFYFERQRSNVLKKCQGCGRKVRIQPDYVICNACAERMERGGDY
jgi:hypothetical protein